MANQSELKWISAVVAPAAVSCQKATGVPASVTISQCIIESGWGKTQLALKGNNFFGIKAEHLNDPNTYIEFPTAEYIHGKKVIIEAEFEKYPSMEASFEDHARLLSQAHRYAPAMAVKQDPFHFANELQTCGYSTSPTYGQTIGNVIRDYNLTQYDKVAA